MKLVKISGVITALGGLSFFLLGVYGASVQINSSLNGHSLGVAFHLLLFTLLLIGISTVFYVLKTYKLLNSRHKIKEEREDILDSDF